MIRAIHQYFTKIPPIPSAYIDGCLYVAIAWFSAWTAAFSTDEAAKYISDEALFWLRSFCATNSAMLLALKMFRSTSFGDHKKEVEKEKATTNL